MPYARFLQVARVAAEATARDLRERMQELAFVGWQMYLTNAWTTGKRMSFAEWLRALGLGEEKRPPKPLGPEEVARLKQEAIEKAQAIIATDKQRRRGGAQGGAVQTVGNDRDQPAGGPSSS